MSERRTPARTADVFFYGLFMDQEVLRSKGLVPRRAEVAWADGMELVIGQRAALAPRQGARAYGVLMSLDIEGLKRLYADPAVSAYQPQTVQVHMGSGATALAVCYNLPVLPSAADRDSGYADKLRALATKIGLPAEYVASI
jgi:hypothetical protein